MTSTSEDSRPVGIDRHTTVALQIALALIFALATLSFLKGFGLWHSCTHCVPDEGSYSLCEIWRDLRSALSFGFGILICGAISIARQQKVPDAGEESLRVQLHAVLM